jgi:hypothetical protein
MKYYKCLECNTYFDEYMAAEHVKPGASRCSKFMPAFAKPRLIETQSGKYGALKNNG